MWSGSSPMELDLDIVFPLDCTVATDGDDDEAEFSWIEVLSW